jgi:transcriptional regulator with XRE-family HTH domain
LEPRRLLIGLGQAVRKVRTERGLSQEELALETGIHRNYIGGIERGERSPTVALVIRLGNALEIEPAELFALAERMGAEPEPARPRGARAS